MILDSKVAIVEIIKEVMLSEGHEAKGISLTDNFIPIVHWYQPDLIILDYNLLSRFNGGELCRQIKSDPKTSSIVVIIISTCPPPFDIFSSYGPDALIYKPFSLKEVTECVRERLIYQEKAGK
nr:response regulator [Mucilaginibacter sp. FT3.2]